MVFGIIVLVGLVILILVLNYVKFFLLQKSADQKEIFLQVQSEYKNDDFNNISQLIEKNNEYLSKIDNFYKNNPQFSQYLDYFFEIERPDGVTLTNVLVKRLQAGQMINFSVSGIAANRDLLQIYKNNIEKNDKISKVNFPANNWLKSSEINFFLSFDISL